jgi:hypothetical protein
MKSFTVATFVALAAVATAQLPDVPQCSLNCFIGPLTSDGCSQLEDFKCHCQKADSLFAAVTPCVKKNCTPAEEADVISKVKDTCAANGITVSIPSDSGSASATPTASVSASSAPASSSAAGTTTAATTGAAYSTKTMASGMPTPSGNGTAPTKAPSPSASEFPGAAARATQAVGVLGAAALAMLAL